MANSAPITLFDLPSKPPCKAWSLNPWKTRLMLNYKGLEYKTEWVEYPNIKPRLEQYVPPNETGFAYSIPTVMLPDGTYIMESRKIAAAIEERYPEPSVHLDSPVLPKVEAIMPSLISAVRPCHITKVPVRILNEVAHDHWVRTRTAMVGMDLEEFSAQKGWEPSWAAAEGPLREITALLNENREGPFFLGQTVSYVDFVWGGYLIWMKRIGDEFISEVLKRSGDGEAHLKLLEGLGPWTKRDDY